MEILLLNLLLYPYFPKIDSVKWKNRIYYKEKYLKSKENNLNPSKEHMTAIISVN